MRANVHSDAAMHPSLKILTF